MLDLTATNLLSLGRNEEMVNSVVDFGFGTFSNAALIRMLPDWLQRYVLAAVICVPPLISDVGSWET